MKDLITTIASISILMVFVLQFATNQVLASKILAVDSAVDSYKVSIKDNDNEEARQLLIDRISAILNCSKEEVSLRNLDGRYEVTAPIRKVIACGNFLGISDEENKAKYSRYGEVL
jgi:hypothetical protein